MYVGLGIFYRNNINETITTATVKHNNKIVFLVKKKKKFFSRLYRVPDCLPILVFYFIHLNTFTFITATGYYSWRQEVMLYKYIYFFWKHYNILYTYTYLYLRKIINYLKRSFFFVFFFRPYNYYKLWP